MVDIMSTVGVILSTVGDTQYHGDIMMHVGGYHEYCGGVQYHGGKIGVPHGAECPPWYS